MFSSSSVHPTVCLWITNATIVQVIQSYCPLELMCIHHTQCTCVYLCVLVCMHRSVSSPHFAGVEPGQQGEAAHTAAAHGWCHMCTVQ